MRTPPNSRRTIGGAGITLLLFLILVPAGLANPTLESAGTPSPILTREEESSAVVVVNHFLEAKTVEERLEHVRDPERVKPLMEKWYKQKGEEKKLPDGEVLRRDKTIEDGRYFIRLYINFGKAGGRVFILEQTEKDIKLDWETAVGHREMSLEEFKNKQPTTPTEFRVKIKPDDFYSNQFIDKEKYASVSLSYPGDAEFKLTGYIDRNQKWAGRILGHFESRISPSMIVNLRYPDGEIKDASQVEIVSIVSESWLIRPEVKKSSKGKSLDDSAKKEGDTD